MARIGRSAEEVRQLREREALASPPEQPPGEPDRVDHGSRDAPSRQPLHRLVEEADVEPGVVSRERRVGCEREEAPHGELLARRAAEVGVTETGEPSDRRRQRDPRIDERLERVNDLERADADGADLAHAVARCRSPVVSR